MFNPSDSVEKLRISLAKEISHTYPGHESTSMARLVMEHLGYSPSRILQDPNGIPDPVFVQQVKEIVHEINTGRPIQYILGSTHFCGLEIRVDESVLIPRPETEEMVHRITGRMEPEVAGSEPPERILDLGTGSGCIALALKTHYSLAVVKGLDLSPDALAVASKNGSNLGLQIEWIKGDMQDDGILEGEERFDLIVSNPPYVLRSEREKMARHVTEFEPRPALFVSDTDPLVHFRAIARISQRLLKEQGVVWVEVNERFGNETARIFINSGFGQTAIIKDIHEKERFIRACR